MVPVPAPSTPAAVYVACVVLVTVNQTVPFKSLGVAP